MFFRLKQGFSLRKNLHFFNLRLFLSYAHPRAWLNRQVFVRFLQAIVSQIGLDEGAKWTYNSNISVLSFEKEVQNEAVQAQS